MTENDVNDAPQTHFDKNVPVVDTGLGWSLLQARIARSAVREQKAAAARFRVVLLAGMAVAVVAVVGVVAAAALGLFGGGDQIASIDGTTTSTAVGGTTVASGATTSTSPSTETTTAGGATTGSSLPVIELMGEPKLDYLHPDYSYGLADAVVLATVVEELPFRQNPLAYQPDDPDGTEHQPVVYKAYVLSVEKAFGPETIPGTLTVFAHGSGTVVLEGVTYEVRNDWPLDAAVGDRLLLPLTKDRYYGTPELEEDEYWVQANWAVFSVDTSGLCTRVAGREFSESWEVANEFSVSYLEGVAIEQGKAASVVE